MYRSKEKYKNSNCRFDLSIIRRRPVAPTLQLANTALNYSFIPAAAAAAAVVVVFCIRANKLYNVPYGLCNKHSLFDICFLIVNHLGFAFSAWEFF